jgi:uncharacterized protein (TIGR00251 family)
MVTIADHPQGCVVRVRVQPGARRTGVQGEHAGALKVAVTAPPQDGRANRALLGTLSEALDLRPWQVELLSGETGRYKRVLIHGLTRDELNARFSAML